ncbi:MAG: phosphoglycerate kinase [Candidatus Nomurabacteria bacterium]|nr:phosphoglycerate kinase [Candidatus Nomurabacteria bacterium]
MRNIKQIKNLKGKKVLVRVDFNVPIKDGKVEDNFRIQKALPTINFLSKKGAKVILITHLGKGGETLLPVSRSLNKFIKAKFVPEIIGSNTTKSVADMKNGDVILLENLRNEKGEQGKDKIFAMNLAKLADIYINEAFPVSHREDTSIVLLPKLLPAYAGFQLENEVKNLSKAIKNTKHPFLFILGGAKFSTKMPLIKKYLKLADHIFIGGALLNDFIKAKGFEVGQSLVDENNYGIDKIIKNKKLIIPDYVIVRNGDGVMIEKTIADIYKDDTILDVGIESVKLLEPIIKKSKLILWNGPLGKYEDGGAKATKEVLKMISKTKTESIIGGGDTVELINEMKMEDKFSFVSTGGGATLDFLANGTLPGIKALK